MPRLQRPCVAPFPFSRSGRDWHRHARPRLRRWWICPACRSTGTSTRSVTRSWRRAGAVSGTRPRRVEARRSRADGQQKDRPAPDGTERSDCRGGGIRTHDLFVPNEARYQAAPHPDGPEASIRIADIFRPRVQPGRAQSRSSRMLSASSWPRCACPAVLGCEVVWSSTVGAVASVIHRSPSGEM